MRTVQFINPYLKIQNYFQIHTSEFNKFIDTNPGGIRNEYRILLCIYSYLRLSLAKEGF